MWKVACYFGPYLAIEYDAGSEEEAREIANNVKDFYRKVEVYEL